MSEELDSSSVEACQRYESTQQERVSRQTAREGKPPNSGDLQWNKPLNFNPAAIGRFRGTAGAPATHEGIDCQPRDGNNSVVAAAQGK